MSKEKKPSTDELYARRQWSDNLSFSRKAMDESKKKTGHLESDKPKPAQPQPAAPTGGERMDQVVQEMNQEIHRMSDAVGERMDSLGSRISRSFGRMVRPLGKSVNHVADSASESFKNMGSGLGKAVIQEFTSVIRNLGDKVAQPGQAAPQNPTAATGTQPLEPSEVAASEALPPPLPPPGNLAQSPSQNPAQLASQVPSFEYHFGILLERKIFFSTIHNRPFLNERDVEAYRPGDPEQIHDWMLRGVEEIRNCAPYGQKLPTPQKGPYTNIPMHEILHQIKPADLEKFLGFVCHRPLPFQQKALKLSEAFATWAHKGAPAN